MNSKTKTTIGALLISLVSFLLASCGERSAHSDSANAHEHEHEGHDQAEAREFAKTPGPNGGRLIETITPNAEFILLADRKAQIVFIDDNGEIVAPEGQTASLIAGDRMNPTTLAFESEDSRLVTSESLPEIDGQPVILTLLASADAEPTVDRFNLKTYKCGGCNLSEYACICGH